MKKNEITIIIDRPIDEVFEFTTNPNNTHLWVPFISKEIADEYPPKINTIYKSLRENGNWSYYKIVEFKKNKIFILSDLDENLFVKYIYYKLDDNKTIIKYSDWITGKEFNSPITELVFKNLKKLMEE